MAYQPTDWKNREVERPRTFTFQENDDGTITLIPAEGKVTEPGTPIMAPLLNKIEGQLVFLDTNLDKLINNTMNAINVGANTQDPNLVSESYIMTKHPNAPDNAVWWYILTFFYTSKDSSKGQIAISYNGTPKMFIRYFLLGEWEPWVEVTRYTTNWMNLSEGPEWATPSGGFLQVRREGDTAYLRGYMLCSGSPTGVVTTIPTGFRPRGRTYFTSNNNGGFFILSNGQVFPTGASNGVSYYFDIAYSIHS